MKRMRAVYLALVLAPLMAGAACQTLPAVVVTGANAFDIRYDAAASTVADVDARARAYCGRAAVLISGETRFDGFAYRSYRCAER